MISTVAWNWHSLTPIWFFIRWELKCCGWHQYPPMDSLTWTRTNFCIERHHRKRDSVVFAPAMCWFMGRLSVGNYMFTELLSTYVLYFTFVVDVVESMPPPSSSWMRLTLLDRHVWKGDQEVSYRSASFVCFSSTPPLLFFFILTLSPPSYFILSLSRLSFYILTLSPPSFFILSLSLLSFFILTLSTIVLHSYPACCLFSFLPCLCCLSSFLLSLCCLSSFLPCLCCLSSFLPCLLLFFILTLYQLSFFILTLSAIFLHSYPLSAVFLHSYTVSAVFLHSYLVGKPLIFSSFFASSFLSFFLFLFFLHIQALTGCCTVWQSQFTTVKMTKHCCLLLHQHAELMKTYTSIDWLMYCVTVTVHHCEDDKALLSVARWQWSAENHAGVVEPARWIWAQTKHQGE